MRKPAPHGLALVLVVAWSSACGPGTIELPGGAGCPGDDPACGGGDPAAAGDTDAPGDETPAGDSPAGADPSPGDDAGCQPVTCEALAAECGEPDDGCGQSLACGGCDLPAVCTAAFTCVCEPEASAAMCTRLAKNCGTLSALDHCGDLRVIDCGTCATPLVCGAQTANVCGSGVCTPTDCATLGAECGAPSDGCADVFDCGGCDVGERCNLAFTCECAPESDSSFCLRLGKDCDLVTGQDNCGDPRTVDCGDCSGGEVCGAGGAANECDIPACEPETCQSLGVTCGQASDGCGGWLDCGPPCVAGRDGEVVVVTGAGLPSSRGISVTVWRGYRWSGSAWLEIPLQVDERVQRTIDSYQPSGVLTLASPEQSYVYTTWGTKHGLPTESQQVVDDDLALAVDEDDELVFFAADAGARAGAADWVAGADGRRWELGLTDPLSGGTTWVYLYTFTAQAPPAALPPAVTYLRDAPTEEVTASATGYGVHWAGRWSLDELRVAGGADLIDRFKGRAFSLAAGSLSENEETWDTLSVYVGDKSGPVRTLREIQGAASGLTTTAITELYPERMRVTTYLRVHVIENVWQYLDLDSRRGTMSYTDNLTTGGVTVDGAPDSVSTALRSWAQVSGAAGELVSLFELVDTTPLVGGAEADLSYFYVDNNAGAAGGGTPTGDGTGDDQPAAWGNHGLHIERVCGGNGATAPSCADNNPLSAPCCLYQPPIGAPVNTGSYYHPLIIRQSMIVRPAGTGPAASVLRQRLDAPLVLSVVAQQR